VFYGLSMSKGPRQRNGASWAVAIFGIAAFLLGNAYSFWAFEKQCYDCGWGVGFPFTFWRGSTLVASQQFHWAGLVGDVVAAATTGVLGGFVVQAFQKHRGR